MFRRGEEAVRHRNGPEEAGGGIPERDDLHAEALPD